MVLKTGPARQQGQKHPAEAAGGEPVGRGSTAQTMRLRNRSLLLNLIREHAPVSRPTLAALSGMHRSNVAVIAATLIDEGLVCDTSGKARGRGRVPSLLILESRSPAVLGISVRPRETTVLVATLDGRMEKVSGFPTPALPQDLVARLGEACLGETGQLSPAFASVRQVVLAVPGRVFPHRGLWMPDFPLYAHFPLEEAIARLLGKPVALANAGNVAAVAALRSSAPALLRGNVAFVAVHEDGVGGGILFDGQLFSGFDGLFAGEFGHMIVDATGPRCACGMVGCWGQLISDHAVWSRVHGEQPFDRGAFHQLLRASQAGADNSRTLLAESVRLLLRGIRTIAVSLNPEYIIVAGEITTAWDFVQEELKKEALFPGFAGVVLPAVLPLASLYEAGTVHYGLNCIFNSPTAGLRPSPKA